MEIDKFSAFVKLTSDYGVPLICSVVLIGIGIKLFFSNQKMLNKMLDKLVEINEKEASVKEHPDDEDVEMLSIVNTKIHQELSAILLDLKCDRGYVYLYHNGGVSSSGLFFQRMSCISEVVASGVLPVSQISQSLHRSSYFGLCNALKDKGEWFSEDVLELREKDGFLYQRLNSIHTESSYVKSLCNRHGQVIGFVGIDYCSLRDDTGVDKIRKVLTSASSIISTLVDIRGEVGG